MYLEYLLTPSDFFESVDRYQTVGNWRALAQEHLGTGWLTSRQGIWLSCREPKRSLPEQGFKIHVSPDLPRAEEQLRLALAVLARHRTAFKFVADAHLLEITNSKSFSRVSSGKFITAYPVDPDAFRALARDLHAALRGFHGPYILTDRPVAVATCVYYRYGAFVDLKTVADGRIVQALRKPDGTLVEDPREPAFVQPDWVDDPFAEAVADAAGDDGGGDDEGGDLLGGRFAITDALQFSNSGGVYAADDVHEGGPAIIKEARPCTATRRTADGFSDAQDGLRAEYEALRQLEPLGVTPRPLALFEEGGHLFLAQERIAAPNWIELFSRDGISLLPFRKGDCDPSGFRRVFIPAMTSAIDGLRRIHAAGYVLGDVSPNNLLVDDDTLRVTFIDLEAAIRSGSDAVRHLATPGFVRRGRGAGARVEASDDWYALGKCGLAAILPLQSLPDVASVSDEELVRLLVDETDLPGAVADLLLALFAADPDAALEHAARCCAPLAVPMRVDGCMPPAPPLEADARQQVAAQTAAFIAAHYRGAGEATFWPVVPEGLRSSRWNLAYGAAGIAGVLARHGTALPASLEQALARDDAFDGVEDAGLYTGLSGIAYWLATRGEHARSLALLDRARNSRLRLGDPCVFNGDAGIGIAALSIHRLTGAPAALGIAAECADALVRAAAVANGRTTWPIAGDNGRAHWGYSRGSAGIAFFLAQFGIAGGDPATLDLALRALHHVLGNVRRNGGGLDIIGAHDQDNGRAMYWANGASGIASVMLRVGLQTDDRALVAGARRLASASFCKYGVQCGQFDGMAGIADGMLDAAGLTGDDEYRELHEHMARGLLLHAKVHGERQLGFAGAGNLRLACDFATGAAGVAAAMARRCGEPRPHFDFALPSAALFPLMPASDASAGSNKRHRTTRTELA